MGVLPQNYAALSDDDKRAARLRIVTDLSTPQSSVRAFQLFHSYYMGGTRKRDLPCPRLHSLWVYCIMQWARNAYAAPRSFAKSTIVGKEFPLLLALAKPNTEILVVCSEGGKARDRAKWFMNQVSKNRRIREDFGDLKGNPRLEERMWNFSVVDFSNGSTIKCMSIKAIHVGERPDLIILDDVEPDPQLVKEWESYTKALSSAVFDVFLPMLDAGTGMMMIGTLYHRRMFLYWMMTTRDRRLGFWNRRLSAIQNKKGEPEWPAKFPKHTIKRLQEELGYSTFMAQYMNAPVSGEHSVLKMHPKRNQYEIDSPDDKLVTDPLASNASLVHWTSEDPKAEEASPLWLESRRPFGETVSRMYRMVLVDYAEGLDDRSDFSAIHVIGYDEHDVLWSLDLWVGRAGLAKLCDLVWQYAYRWKARVVGVEAVGAYKALYEKMATQRAAMEGQHGWMPFLKRISYPAHLGKPVRIAGLEWRFEAGRVRIPVSNTGAYRMLLRQIEAFTMDMQSLRWDDALDTLAMHCMILKPRTKGVTPENREQLYKSFAQRLIEGQCFDDVTGVPYITGMRPEDIPAEAILAARSPPEDKGKERISLPTVFDIRDLGRALDDARRR